MYDPERPCMRSSCRQATKLDRKRKQKGKKAGPAIKKVVQGALDLMIVESHPPIDYRGPRALSAARSCLIGSEMVWEVWLNELESRDRVVVLLRYELPVLSATTRLMP